MSKGASFFGFEGDPFFAFCSSAMALLLLEAPRGVELARSLPPSALRDVEDLGTGSSKVVVVEMVLKVFERGSGYLGEGSTGRMD